MRREKTKLKRLIESKTLLLLSFLIFTWLAVSFVQTTYRRYRLLDQLQRLQDKASRLEKDNKSLKKSINYYSSQSFLEKEARRKLNLKKPGEKVVIINLSSDEASQSQGINDEKKEIFNNNFQLDNKSNWQRWISYFLKR